MASHTLLRLNEPFEEHDSQSGAQACSMPNTAHSVGANVGLAREEIGLARAKVLPARPLSVFTLSDDQERDLEGAHIWREDQALCSVTTVSQRHFEDYKEQFSVKKKSVRIFKRREQVTIIRRLHAAAS